MCAVCKYVYIFISIFYSSLFRQQNHSSNTPGSANYQYGDYYYDRSGYAQQYQYYQQQCEEQPGVPPPPALEQTNSVEQPSQKPPPPPPPPPCEEDMEREWIMVTMVTKLSKVCGIEWQ